MTAATATLTLLLIEFLDEFVFGARGAAWPSLRSDLNLNYAQVGLLLGLPGLVGNFVEPVLGILGDVRNRRRLILGGGAAFATALLFTGLSQDFLAMLGAFILFSPASGAFVTLSQATLMDSDPSRHEQNMARWTFAGSLGVVAGPLALGAMASLGGGWRTLFVCLAGLAAALVAIAFGSLRPRHAPWPDKHTRDLPRTIPFRIGAIRALRALRRGDVLRWLALLESSDLMGDVLLGFLALYFIDEVRTTPAQAVAAVAVWSGMGLVGNLLLIPLLERVRGLRYLRVSAMVELLLFPAFLLAPTVFGKFMLLGLLGLFSTGWYSILKAQLYSAMPGQSGTVMTVSNIFGLVGALIPLSLGLVAERLGLLAALWLLLLGPLALLIGTPKRVSERGSQHVVS